MVVELIVVGRTTEQYVEMGIAEYVRRLSHYIRFSINVIPELKGAKNMRQEQIKQAEGELILSRVSSSDRLVLLDDKGMQPCSILFSQWMQNSINRGTRRLVFVVGGAYGFSDDVYKRADEKLSLSKMTFSHQMVRLIFVEQLYRAMTILRSEPYHHQ